MSIQPLCPFRNCIVCFYHQFLKSMTLLMDLQVTIFLFLFIYLFTTIGNAATNIFVQVSFCTHKRVSQGCTPWSGIIRLESIGLFKFIVHFPLMPEVQQSFCCFIPSPTLGIARSHMYKFTFLFCAEQSFVVTNQIKSNKTMEEQLHEECIQTMFLAIKSSGWRSLRQAVPLLIQNTLL